jgi:hypothetical protein
MFATRIRSVLTTATAVEVGIAGWALGHGWLWLAAMVAAITLADCSMGVVRRRAMADVVGVELGALLVAFLMRSADGTLTTLIAVACAAWLIRPNRQTAADPAPDPQLG